MSPDTRQPAEDNDRELARLVRGIHERAATKRQQAEGADEGERDG